MSYQRSAAALTEILAHATAGPLTTDRENPAAYPGRRSVVPRQQVACWRAVLIS